MLLISKSFVIVALLSMVGCGADFNSIGRRTTLPASGDGVAIHLDAQQRLTLFTAQRYCAEPSPDALAAYAQALGLGASAPSQGAASLAGASQSNVGSIGLRTQSITIMRDALYRMCEAYNNEMLGDVMVATLLGRSQDLTAVILAVEQLTGAVAANQVILTGTASANASANLVANDQALAAAKENVEKRKAAVEEATSVRDAANTKLADAKTAEVTAQGNLDRANSLPATDPTRQQQIGEAQSNLNRATEDRKSAEKGLADAESDLKNKQDQLASAERVVETIEASQDAALTNAAANTGGSGNFSVVAPAKQLDAEATREIAGAVRGMVAKALDKTYTADSCMALITSERVNSAQSTNPNLMRVFNLCAELVSRGIEKALRIESNFDVSGTDPNIELLARKIREDSTGTLAGKIVNWMKRNEVKAGLHNVVFDREYADVRRRLIRDLNIVQ